MHHYKDLSLLLSSRLCTNLREVRTNALGKACANHRHKKRQLNNGRHVVAFALKKTFSFLHSTDINISYRHYSRTNELINGKVQRTYMGTIF
jgi:hypothetical protein